MDGRFSGLGLDFYDTHIYEDGGGLPTAAQMNVDKPIIVGEFGQGDSTFDDTTDNTIVTNLVSEAIETGWAGVAKWDYEYPGNSTDVYDMLEPQSTQTDLIWRPGTQTLSNYYHEYIDGDSGGDEPVVAHTFPSGLQMMSIPYDLSGIDPSTVLSPSTPMAAWDAASDPPAYSVAPATPADSYRIGEGYWIHAPTGGSTIIAAIGTGTAPGATTTIALSQGWNMIGNPYNAYLPESDIQVQVGAGTPETLAEAVSNGTIYTTLYFYPGPPADPTSYGVQDASAPLAAFQGYWVYAFTACNLISSSP
jgi:hypothetical protein